MTEALRHVGRPVPQIEAAEKVTGAGLYTHDLTLPGMLYGAILRSPHAHARLRRVDTAAAAALPGVCAVIAGAEVRRGYLNFGPAHADRWPLARDRVRFFGEEVAAVAAETPEAAAAALRAIAVDYEVLPAVFAPEAALAPGAPVLHDRPGLPANVAQRSTADWGGIAAAFAEAAHVVEGRFAHGIVAPVCLETNAVLASHDAAAGTLDIWAGTQAPFFARKEVAHITGLALHAVRIRPVLIGGGFGGKSQCPEPIAIAALLSMRAGRPVKIVLTRLEEFLSGKTDHAKDMRLATAADAGGRLTGRRCDYVVDNGAYTHMGPAYVSAVRQRTSSLYRVAAAGFDGRLVHSNKVPGGSYRGMGAPQIIWAIETQIDELAERLGKDPLAYRLELANRPGETTPQGFRISTCALADCLTEAARRIGWDEARRRPPRTGARWRGVGLAAMINPSVGVLYPEGNFANVALELDAGGGLRLATQAADCGTWQNTVLAQLAAEVLDVAPERIAVVHMDTEIAPDDLGSAASRVTFVTGQAALNAGTSLRAAVSERLAARWGVAPEAIAFAGDALGLPGDNRRWLSWAQAAALTGPLRVEGRHEIDLARPDPKTGYGHYAATYGFGAQAAEVEVDPGTGQVRVLRVVSVLDIGRVVNPLALDGQMQGGIVQGIGMALSEELVFAEGRPVNTSLISYKVPRIFEAPRIETAYVETRDPTGPLGAKAGGEHSINPTVAAVANAVAHATGVRPRQLPVTPHRLRDALAAAAAGDTPNATVTGTAPGADTGPGPGTAGRRAPTQPWRRAYNLEVAAVRAAYPKLVYPALKRLGARLGRRLEPATGFDIATPEDLAAALALLAGPPGAARVLAGGTDLLTGIRQGIVSPRRLVDISGLAELQGIVIADDRVSIGAAVTLSDILAHDGVRAAVPMLAEGLELVATRQIRNVATLGGDLCQEKRCWFFRSALPCFKNGGASCPCYAITNDNRHHAILGAGRCAAPCIADAAPMLTALDATAVIAGPSGPRRQPVETLYRAAGEPRIAPGEILQRIEIPRLSDTRAAYEKYAQWRGDFPEASAAVRLRLDGGRLRDVRLSLGGVAPLPMRARHAEAHLAAAGLGDAAIAEAARRSLRGALPLRDNAAKADMLVAVTERALLRARDGR